MENRTVLDTNIWIDYIISNRMKELSELIFSNNVVYLRSNTSLEELRNVLSYDKFKKFNPAIKYTLQLYTAITEYIETKAEFIGCPDPKDNFLFDLAIQGNAGYLVSRDRTVLATHFPPKNKNIKLMNFVDFKKEIGYL
jgi:putative PIN family toxin of toxin-antitoxin system